MILLLVFACGASVFAADIAPFPPASSRIYALGGPHTAYTQDITTLAVNPAALKTVKKQFSIGEIGAGTHGDIIALIPLIGSVASGSFEDFDSSKIADLTSGSDGKIPLGFELRGPLSLGYMNNSLGFGFGLFDRVYFDTRFIGTALRLNANADFLLNGGYAYRIVDKGLHALDVGIAVKAFGRYSVGLNGSVVDLVDNSETLTDNSPMDIILGGGFDLGVLYHLEGFAFGLTGNDVFSRGLIQHISGTDSGSSEIGSIKPQVNLGAAYSFTPWKYASLSLMLDYR
ncbi:MAG: conjugal transfer protein TraF, partial [Treponema sp.]|nr:conjugal transfer protein TraF [Treponema sp.]